MATSYFPALLDLEGGAALDAGLCRRESPGFRPQPVLCGTQLR